MQIKAKSQDEQTFASPAAFHDWIGACLRFTESLCVPVH
jgi:hypothetical protein